MNKTTIAAILIIAIGAFSFWKSDSSGEESTPEISAPTASLQEIVQPITKLLNDNKSHKQASILAAFYFETGETIQRDEENEQILKTKNHLRTFCERSATLRFQGIFSKVPGLAEAIHGGDGALSKILRLKAGQLDHKKAADAFHAIAWACQEAE